MSELGRDLLVLETVVVEVDQLLRSRMGSYAARAFLAAMATEEHTPVAVTMGMLRRAVAFDARFAGLDLGVVDGSVMALAERERFPILTFDFEHFRATRPARGFWRLVVDEAGYRRAVGSG